MSESDGSIVESVAGALEGDTCDTCEPSASACEAAIEDAADDIRSAEKEADRRTGEDAESWPAVSRASGRAPLLDSSSSLLRASSPSIIRPRRAAPDSGAIERRVPFEVFRAAWPALDPLRGTGVHAVSLTLTSPDAGGIADAARRFTIAAAGDGRLGVLIVREQETPDEQPHYHGLGLTLDPQALRHRWIAITGARANAAVAEPLSGWPLDCRKPHTAAPNLAGVVWYAFKSWPVRAGHYSLEADVVASGVLAAPWWAARAALEGRDGSDLEGRGDASPRRRTCHWCGESLPPKARRDKARHDHCRKAHSKASRRAELGAASAEDARRLLEDHNRRTHTVR